MRDFPLHTALAIVTLGALIAVVHPPNAAQLLRGLVDFTPELTPLSPMVRHREAAPLLGPPRAAATLPHGKPAPSGPLLDDSAAVLDAFYGALRRTGNGEPGAVTRIVHYGDSPTTADLITGDVRAQLQARFGDAGHGFILPAKPWAWYQHAGVTVSGSGWQMVPASHFEARDGLFGLGGVSFTGGPSAASRIVFEKAAYTRFEVWFLRQPEGGRLTLSADDVALGGIDTAGETKDADFAVFQAPVAASTLTLRVAQGHVRLFGVIAENSAGGLVYDSLGLNGASITVLSRMFNQGHWAAELQHRHPDLVIVNYGTNEADFPAFIDKQYEKELREAIRRLRAALPETSLLIMSPMDRGYKTGGEIATMPTIPRIVELQRRVARETGCGFFDTYQAMGGEGTMARWYAAQPRLVSADFIHPYPAGGKMIATRFTREIISGLNRYSLRESRGAAH
jgi:lysophospholipase L1-like esterase